MVSLGGRGRVVLESWRTGPENAVTAPVGALDFLPVRREAALVDGRALSFCAALMVYGISTLAVQQTQEDEQGCIVGPCLDHFSTRSGGR